MVLRSGFDGEKGPKAALLVDTAMEFPIALDQADRYADASGDRFEIHLDDEAARRVGLPGRIVHGF